MEALLAQWLLQQGVNMATWVQILNEDVRISYSTNVFGKDMTPTNLSPAVDK